MTGQDNIMWNTPNNVIGLPDTQDAWCSLDGFACYEYAWSGTPMLIPPEAYEVVSVEVTFHIWSSVLVNFDDRFELKWGIGDVGIFAPPIEWAILETITAGSAPMVRVYNITDHHDVWTLEEISNIYLKIEGFEGLMGEDRLNLYWDASSVIYEYRIIAEPVEPPVDDDDGGGPSARNIWDILAMLLIMLFVLLLIYLFMKWTQDRFEREVP